MAIFRDFAIVFLVISCANAATDAREEDGLPRPEHIPEVPTTSYGPEPEVLASDGSPADCTWYGFATVVYDISVGLRCLSDLRQQLVDSGESLTAYRFYFSTGPTGSPPGSDPASVVAYCHIGCFNLNGGAPAYPPTHGDPGPAPSPSDPYLRGPSPAPFYWPGAPPSKDFAPPPTSGD